MVLIATLQYMSKLNDEMKGGGLSGHKVFSFTQPKKRGMPEIRQQFNMEIPQV